MNRSDCMSEAGLGASGVVPTLTLQRTGKRREIGGKGGAAGAAQARGSTFRRRAIAYTAAAAAAAAAVASSSFAVNSGVLSWLSPADAGLHGHGHLRASGERTGGLSLVGVDASSSSSQSSRVLRRAEGKDGNEALEGLMRESEAQSAEQRSSKAAAEDDDYDDDDEYEEDDYEEDEPEIATPVMYKLPQQFRRLIRQGKGPGHVVQRRWLKKGKNNGYVSVPFVSAVRDAMRPQADVSICLVGRRETEEKVKKQWTEVLDELPLFDISGEVSAPGDLDPMEPPWNTKLERLPELDEMKSTLQDKQLREQMEEKFLRSFGELKNATDAKLLREVVKGLPQELIENEDVTELVRLTVWELLKLLWTAYSVTNSPRLLWRFACTDSDIELDPSQAIAAKPFGLRGYFVMAGQGLEFVPPQFVDPAKLKAERSLSGEQVARMGSQDWAKAVTVPNCNITAALKKVPAGWTTLLKGDTWEDMTGAGAAYRLPQSGRRIFLQVDAEAPKPEPLLQDSLPGSEGAQQGEAASEGSSNGMLGTALAAAGLGAALTGAFKAVKQSAPWQAGLKARKQTDQLLRALKREPDPEALRMVEEQLGTFDTNAWRADFGPTGEAPTVLVIGGQSQTGRIITRKLVIRGFHVIVLKESSKGVPSKVVKLVNTGASLTSATMEHHEEPVYNRHLPRDLYDAVAGADKIIVCDCDEESKTPVTWKVVKNILAGWQMYRLDFAESQRAYTSKVCVFNFDRDSDFDLWSVERDNPSDVCFGQQHIAWNRNSMGGALFIGGFMEDYGQALIKSPVLKLNLAKFTGLMIRVYNQAVGNTARSRRYSFFLRTSHFEDTRIQYEFDFECKPSSWSHIRMPFHGFRAARADGEELDPIEIDDAGPLDRADVQQMGIIVRTVGEDVVDEDIDELDPFSFFRKHSFSLQIKSVRALRVQKEPQVVHLGKETLEHVEEEEEEEDEEFFMSLNDDIDYEALKRMQEAEEEAEQEIDELVGEELAAEMDEDPRNAENVEGEMTFESDLKKVKTTAQAVIESGLAYTLIKVNGLNAHPSGRFPMSIHQASVERPPLSVASNELGKISRGDAAELVVSSLLEPNCVNTEISAGEPLRGGHHAEGEEQPVSSKFSAELSMKCTVQESVRDYLKKLVPNV
eukprot:TRINITY_DN100568_c0_g1_i1.p1 TRINITY_DN100568_c0_g1~~TRINITY_DN100568_c0_g1_i1.p1  ORF type:complete len:1148 (+),score=387.92 TRINITY_DN100568_c0_g1_i1:110-3553(+)